MLMVSPRDLRRDVTSSRIGRMALGGKSETDDVVDILRCACGYCSLLIGVNAVVLVFEQLMAWVRGRWRMGLVTEIDEMKQRYNRDMRSVQSRLSMSTVPNQRARSITNHRRPAQMEVIEVPHQTSSSRSTSALKPRVANKLSRLCKIRRIIPRLKVARRLFEIRSPKNHTP